MSEPKNTPTPFNGPLVVQELGSRPGYPAWTQFAIRDQKTNVHIATVGHVDRYFEGKAESHAEFIVRAVNAHEALVSALTETLRALRAHIASDAARTGIVAEYFCPCTKNEVARAEAALRAAKGES